MGSLRAALIWRLGIEELSSAMHRVTYLTFLIFKMRA